jgi:hypothetical protein
MKASIGRRFLEFLDPAKKVEYLGKVNEVQAWFCDVEFDLLPLTE